MIQGTASEAVLVVLLAARDRVLRRVGKNSLEKLVVYASDQTHSALQKACQVFFQTCISIHHIAFNIHIFLGHFFSLMADSRNPFRKLQAAKNRLFYKLCPFPRFT